MSKSYYDSLYNLFNTPLYKDSNISIHPQWLNMFTLCHQTHFNNISCETNDVPCDNNNEDGFEEEQKDISTNTMVQNKLSFEQIYEYFENVRIVDKYITCDSDKLTSNLCEAP